MYLKLLGYRHRRRRRRPAGPKGFGDCYKGGSYYFLLLGGLEIRDVGLGREFLRMVGIIWETTGLRLRPDFF